MSKHLILFGKLPLPGYCKARLAKGIGDTASAGVYARLLFAVLERMLPLRSEDVTIELSLASSAARVYFCEAFPEIQVTAQCDGTLGVRMCRAFERGFAAGARDILLVGTDLPALDVEYTRSAFQALRSELLVVGPTEDGGYGLIGMRDRTYPIFEDITWGSHHVLRQTLAAAKHAGMHIEILPTLRDLDDVADLRTWQSTLRGP